MSTYTDVNPTRAEALRRAMELHLVHDINGPSAGEVVASAETFLDFLEARKN